MRAMEISRTGLDVEWRRLEVIANNIANINSTVGGKAFQPLQLITGPKAGFGSYLDEGAQPQGVAIYGVEPQNVGTRRVLEPQNPAADTDGYVTYPDIDQASAMTAMIKTERAYEANLVALNLTRQMYGKALELGKRS